MANKFRHLVTKRKVSRPIRSVHLWNKKSVASSSPWTPADIAITAWYDPSNKNTITEAANLVSNLADLSGNGWDLQQGLGADQMETNLITIGGLNALKCRTSDNLANPLGQHPLGSSVNAFTVIGISREVVRSSGVFSVSMNGVSTSAPSINKFTVPYSDGKVYFDVNDFTNGRIITTGTYSVNDVLITVGDFDKDTDQNLYINGTQVGTATGISTPANCGQFVLGDKVTDMDFGEYLLFTEQLSDSDRQKCEGYLAHKWGLQANLPANHPWKTSPPTK